MLERRSELVRLPAVKTFFRTEMPQNAFADLRGLRDNGILFAIVSRRVHSTPRLW
jgi:hypothetical protein